MTAQLLKPLPDQPVLATEADCIEADLANLRYRQSGGPAFPVPDQQHQGGLDGYYGMTLRDYFAIRATEQDIENHRAYEVHGSLGHRMYTMTVERAKYAYADAMLKARSE